MSLLPAEEKKLVFEGKECSLMQYQVLATVCLFPFKRSPLFKEGIKIDILETQLIRHNEAEPHFNFRDSGRYVKNTPKRTDGSFYSLINTACTATVTQIFIEEIPSRVIVTS